MQQSSPLTPKSWDGLRSGVHGISETAYDKLHKKLGSHAKVFEAAAQHQSPRRHGLAVLCKAHGIDPVA